MMSHFNDVTGTDLWLTPIPRLNGSVGGYIDWLSRCGGHPKLAVEFQTHVDLKSKFVEVPLLFREQKMTLICIQQPPTHDTLLMVIEWIALFLTAAVYVGEC